MLESLLNFKELNRKPYLMFVWAFIICLVSIAVSVQLSYEVVVSGSTVSLTGLFAVLFIVMGSVYLITMIIKKEERIEEKQIIKYHQQSFWPRHKKDIMLIMLYFAGLTLAFAISASVLPAETFQVQVSKINQIQGITGAAIDYNALFTQILSNNIQVLIFSFFFSFIFGAGAAFILAWNASILGVYIGQISQSVWSIPVVSMAFIPHGIPEIAGYVCAGLAGSLISAAIIRKHRKGVLKIITTDSLKVLLLGIVLILIAAGIEAYL
jgi:uncharacterized membrane protein SpoIIM required for sporulation